MTRSLAALILSAALASPLAAQEARLSGTVAEVFGEQIVLSTDTGRILVTLPQGSAGLAPGTRLDLTGTRSGETFAATTVTVGAVAEAAEAAEAMLPPALRGLGLTEISTRPDDDGEVYIHARTPTGWLRAEAWGERVLEVQADGAGLPQALVDALLPASARAEPRLAGIVQLTEIDLDEDDGEISVEGFAADGMRIEIEFTRDGRLQGYERERDDRRSLSETAARARLVELGYSGIGLVERGGRHVTAVAVNPFGDRVEVRLDDQGRVERERLWQE